MTQKNFPAIHVVHETGCDYDRFVQAMEDRLGVHNPVAYQHLLSDPMTVPDAMETIGSQAGPFGLMLFTKLQMGALFALENRFMKACQCLIGNPLIAFSMMRHNVRAGLYAPLRILVHGDANGHAVVEYDLPSSLFGSLGHAEIDGVGKDLDAKLGRLIESARQSVIDTRVAA